jgi:hypothetical protein
MIGILDKVEKNVGRTLGPAEHNECQVDAPKSGILAFYVAAHIAEWLE